MNKKPSDEQHETSSNVVKLKSVLSNGSSEKPPPQRPEKEIFSYINTELAWAAGYFDGEGSVGFYTGKGNGTNGCVRAWASDKLVRQERINRPHCKEGKHGPETYTLIKGTPRCRICMSAHLNKPSVLGLLFLGHL